MSRIGRLPIILPAQVKINIDGKNISVEGPKGKLSLAVSDKIGVALSGDSVAVSRSSEQKNVRALHGLTRALIANMVSGVHKGFEKVLEITGVGYRAAVKGKDLELSVGFSYPVTVKAEKDISFAVEGNTRVKVIGADRQKVGQMAAKIRAIRPPEPYKGKGIKYFDEIIRRKVGKATGT